MPDDDESPPVIDDEAPPVEPHANERARRIAVVADFLGQHERIFNVLSTTVTAVFTVVLATSTVFLWKETKDLRDFAQQQSADMKDSIAEANRSAKAMEDVALAVAANARAANESVAVFKDANVRQMRAYLTVGLGGVLRQDSSTNYHFEVRMILQNVGNTPAYKEASNIHVDVLPFPLPQDFQFPAFDDSISSAAVVGPHLSYILTGFATRLYSDDDVHEIEFGSNKRLYVFGTVKYEDAFGVSRKTDFCQVIEFLKNNGFMSRNTPNHNDAD
jgi:hypothetical protein